MLLGYPQISTQKWENKALLNKYEEELKVYEKGSVKEEGYSIEYEDTVNISGVKTKQLIKSTRSFFSPSKEECEAMISKLNAWLDMNKDSENNLTKKS